MYEVEQFLSHMLLRLLSERERLSQWMYRRVAIYIADSGGSDCLRDAPGPSAGGASAYHDNRAGCLSAISHPADGNHWSHPPQLSVKLHAVGEHNEGREPLEPYMASTSTRRRLPNCERHWSPACQEVFAQPSSPHSNEVILYAKLVP